MPFLNWSDLSPQPTMNPHPKFQSEMRLEISASRLPELVDALRETFQQREELRLALPGEWLLFWKLRPTGETESRLLLAHPVQDQWVGTLALSETHGQALVGWLSQATSGQSAAVSSFQKPGRVSNMELLIVIT